MDPVATKSIYELKSTWTRLIHRIHTLGITQQTYFNKVAGLAEKRVYPRQVPSYLEDSSSSLDGTHLWRMNNWKKGWVVLDEENKDASFLFSSTSGELFHKIDLVQGEHWDCLECLLMVFVKKKMRESERIPAPAFKMSTGGSFHNCGSVTDVMGKALEEKRAVSWTIPVSGGVVTRTQRIEKMVLQSGCVVVHTDKGKLVINPSEVKHEEVVRKRGSVIGTLYNNVGLPQLIVQAA